MNSPDPMDPPQTDSEFTHGVIAAVCAAMIENCDEFTALDQAIGDGDHGINMKRGFEAVLSEVDPLAAQPLSGALQAAGMKLVMTVGGASGPLYGTLFLALGKHIASTLTAENLPPACRAALQAVMARGKSEPGEKTMLDVLAPVVEALEAGTRDPDQLIEVARSAAQQTIAMKATRGRAAYLGERSIGHMDPGACSSAVLIETICRFIKENT